jgi:hypothetical protein
MSMMMTKRVVQHMMLKQQLMPLLQQCMRL